MIVPLNRSVPVSVAMVTLWGMASSALVKVMPNATPAGPVSELGENWKPRASIPRTTGAAVGPGVAFGVGLAVFVGAGVGAGVG